MTNTPPENSAPEADISSANVVPFSAGTALREARVHLGLSVDEVSHRIKFAPRQIEALEADDFAHLPEAAFLRGFVRSYARLVQLDVAPLLLALPHPPDESVPLQTSSLIEVPFPTAESERKQNLMWLAGAILVVAALALAAWLLGGKPKEQKEQSAAETVAPPVQNVPQPTVAPVPSVTVETLAPPAAMAVSAVPEALTKKSVAAQAPQATQAPQASVTDAAKQADIRLSFDGDSWVEIYDKKGKSLLSQLNHAGSSQAINGLPPYTLVIGNAKAVHLSYKGQVVDLAPHTSIEVARLKLE